MSKIEKTDITDHIYYLLFNTKAIKIWNQKLYQVNKKKKRIIYCKEKNELSSIYFTKNHWNSQKFIVVNLWNFDEKLNTDARDISWQIFPKLSRK